MPKRKNVPEATEGDGLLQQDVKADLAVTNEKWIPNVLRENKNRFVLFPIIHKKFWEFYKFSAANIWFTEEVDVSSDMYHIDCKKRIRT